MGLKGKSKLDELEMPQLDETPVIPDDEEELDRQIREMAEDDPAVSAIFERAQQYADLNATSCDAGHKLACLHLVRDELVDTRRLLWWALFELRKARKAADAATASANNIIDGICSAIVKAENMTIKAKLESGDEEVLRRIREDLLEGERTLMDERLTQIQAKLDAHYNRLAALRWGNQDGFVIHGKWVKWIVGIALTSFLYTSVMILLGAILFVNQFI